MLNSYKFIEIIVSLQSLIITTMIPVYMPLPLFDRSNNSFEMPITLQIPTIIFLTIIFNRKVVYSAFTIYIIIGLFIYPVFHQGGSIGYLLTPNFGYLIGIYPLIKIIDDLNNKNNINIGNIILDGILAISAMHFIGIIYNFFILLFFNRINIFFYNLGKYSVGLIGYHLIMFIPLVLLIKSLKYFKYNK